MNSLKQETQEVPIINEQEEDEPQIIKLTQKYLHELKIDSKQIYNYKKNFENENDLFMTNLDSAQVEQFQDNIQTQLEKADQCDGFELVIDCETCYGEIGLKVVDSLNDLQGNSKTPKIVISILDPNMNTKNRIINRSLTLTQYQENSTLLVPLELKEMQIHSKQLELNQQYSFLINNILSSYKCTQEYVSMHEFCKRITPAPQNNIFNILASIPSLQDKPENNILNYKQAKNLDKFYFSQDIINMNSERESYGESYFLRGISPFPNERNLKSYGVDIRILDYIYQVPQLYDYTDVMPFHSNIFSNESYKYTLLKLYKELNSIKKMGFLQYEKQSFEDDQQLKYDLCQLIENYGGIDEEEQL
ncbi:unnamed protein product [Paramecium pentaurelia]|uniref:Uncharacterized protein n=1 Tax=Paramecium pentaurelia TaxID=43138 RepID=A0A8S1S5X2_9CILI|nr:unnamed protein product [Paramecium pentaurelia]